MATVENWHVLYMWIFLCGIAEVLPFEYCVFSLARFSKVDALTHEYEHEKNNCIYSLTNNSYTFSNTDLVAFDLRE